MKTLRNALSTALLLAAVIWIAGIFAHIHDPAIVAPAPPAPPVSTHSPAAPEWAYVPPGQTFTIPEPAPRFIDKTGMQMIEYHVEEDHQRVYHIVGSALCADHDINTPFVSFSVSDANKRGSYPVDIVAADGLRKGEVWIFHQKLDMNYPHVKFEGFFHQ